jgi:hypothetical protein
MTHSRCWFFFSMHAYADTLTTGYGGGGGGGGSSGGGGGQFKNFNIQFELPKLVTAGYCCATLLTPP